MSTLQLTIERIQAKSSEFNLARFLLTLIALPFFVGGWVAYYGWRAVLTAASWIWAAVLVGWQMASEPASQGGP